MFQFDPAIKSNLLDILEKTNFWPNKILGQNFLISQKIRDQICSSADIQKNDLVIEVGPGMGTLTVFLAQLAKRVLVIEKDRAAIEILKLVLKTNDIKNVEIIQGDVLKTDISKLAGKNHYKIVANLPYYLTSRFFRKIFEERSLPEVIVATIQKEVARRIKDKEPRHSQLSLSVQFFSEPQIVDLVKAEYFWPKPKVDSAILKLKIKKSLPDKKNLNRFFDLIHAGFSSKRKILISNLSNNLKIEKTRLQKIFQELSIPENFRAQEIPLEKWLDLVKKCFRI
ncbi:MAG: Ribosomal RNA small subunit methyltransferase A [Parcubacteria group bacterium GW2011_GWA2_39_18]|nr:MAG: Ribosomal RNA small subunit methyltransferase A [Parcubacteria group bacterium GW2011_GWA2_39_18]